MEIAIIIISLLSGFCVTYLVAQNIKMSLEIRNLLRKMAKQSKQEKDDNLIEFRNPRNGLFTNKIRPR